MKKLVIIFFMLFSLQANASGIPDSFVEIREVIPDAVMDIRYYTEHNFVGARVTAMIGQEQRTKFLRLDFIY